MELFWDIDMVSLASFHGSSVHRKLFTVSKSVAKSTDEQVVCFASYINLAVC